MTSGSAISIEVQLVSGFVMVAPLVGYINL